MRTDVGTPIKILRGSRLFSQLVESLEPRRLLAGQLFVGEGPAVGDSPVAVVAADFNGDGKTDLATANALSGGSGSRITVALGSGDGTFQMVYLFVSSSGGPTAMAVADLNADGRPDLVLAGASGLFQGSVTVFQNKSSSGSSPFDVGSTYAISAYPSGVTIGDFNNDAKPDIAVANRNITGGSGSLTVLNSTSYGGFGTPVTTTLPQSLRDVDARDMDGDGKVDLVFAADYGSIGLGILRGNGDGTFAAPTAVVSGTNYTAVATGDLNGDGVPDVAGTAANTATATVHFANSDGTFAAPASYAVGVTAADIVRADLNADGKPDLVTADNSADTVTVLLNDGAGAFTPRSLFAGDRTMSVAAADLNGDGRVDLAVSSRGSSTVSVLLGSGSGAFVSPHVTSVRGTGAINPSRSLAGDFDGDGVLDVIVVNANDGTGNTGSSSLAFRHGNGDGTFAEPLVSYKVDSDPTAPVLGDFNGDGRLDVAVSSTSFSNLFVLLGNGDGTFAAPIKSSVGTGSALVALDFDKDGKTDLAVMRSSGVSLYRGLGTGRFTSLSLGYTVSPTGLVTADFNRDGNADLAVADSGGVTPLLGNGDGTFTPQTRTSASSGIIGMAAGDMTGDGIPDVAVMYGSSSNSSFGRLYGTAAGTFVNGMDVQSVTSPRGIIIADFDGDGRGDVVVAGLNVAYAYNGTSIFPPHVVAIGNSSTSLATGDFTGDGLPDLLAATISTITVTPGVPPVTVVTDPAVSAANGVLTLGPGSVTLDVAPGVPNMLRVTTATRQNWLAVDGITQVVLSGAALTLNTDLGRLGANAVALTVNSGATADIAVSQHLSTLTVSGSAALAAGGGRVLRVTGFSNFPSGRLDLNDNALVYDYTFGGTTQRSTIRNLIKTARAGGTWTGAGLTSTTARNAIGANTTLGYMEATDYKAIYGPSATFDGETIDDTAVLVRYTLYGDADFNRTVDFNDFLKLQNGFGGTNGSFAQGDFNYDGATDFNDFLMLQNNFNQTLPATRGAGSTVPDAPAVPAGTTAAPLYPVQITLFSDDNRDGNWNGAENGFAQAKGLVWADVNGNGLFDAGEPRLADGANVLQVPLGSYFIRFRPNAGYVATTPYKDIPIDMRGESSHIGIHFGLAPALTPPPVTPPPPPVNTAGIAGTVFRDNNKNGKFDAGDGIGRGAVVYLDLDNDGVKDANEPSAVADSSGKFSFKNLAAGRYRVRQVLAPGTVDSTPAAYVTLARGQAAKGVLLGSRAK